MSQKIVKQAYHEDMFTALADETRLKILQALWKFDDQKATYSELKDAIDMHDSGKFNYHLGQLVGLFITKSDGEYVLSQAGKHVNGAIASGVYSGQKTIEEIELNSSCRNCGSEQTLRYENEVAHVECHSCQVDWVVPVPPAVLAGRDREEIPVVISRYFQTIFQMTANGFCSYCYGQITPKVGPISTMDVGSDYKENPGKNEEIQSADVLVVQFDCQRCGATAGSGLDDALLISYPEVAQFYHKNGIDIQNHLIWDHDLHQTEHEIQNRDPFIASVAYRVGTSELTITVDEILTVIESQCEEVSAKEKE